MQMCHHTHLKLRRGYRYRCHDNSEAALDSSKDRKVQDLFSLAEAALQHSVGLGDNSLSIGVAIDTSSITIENAFDRMLLIEKKKSALSVL